MRLRLGIVLLISSFAMPGFAAERVIQNGIDIWTTVGQGMTFVDFARNPIPAGFFCPNSAPFTGKVAFRGEPIVTDSPQTLGKADTIVQRLDDAAFNRRGVAVTRIQVRALSLKSLAPIKTACGSFNVAASLDGVQPITRMRIIREHENGGRFFAPLALNTKLSFTPVGRAGGEVLEISMPVRFPATPNVPWRSKAGAPEPAGFILVDTDGDRVTDTYLPGPSNFSAGQSGHSASRGKRGVVTEAATWYCHDGDGCTHCYCEGYRCPIEP